jgi:hypothetical protein
VLYFPLAVGVGIVLMKKEERGSEERRKEGRDGQRQAERENKSKAKER